MKEIEAGASCVIATITLRLTSPLQERATPANLESIAADFAGVARSYKVTPVVFILQPRATAGSRLPPQSARPHMGRAEMSSLP